MYGDPDGEFVFEQLTVFCFGRMADGKVGGACAIMIAEVYMPQPRSPSPDTNLLQGNLPIPVVDIFAGPGGLSEGFSSFIDTHGRKPVFEVVVSIEKDPVAHRTLELRAIYRQLAKRRVPEVYYQYLRGEVDRRVFLAHRLVAEAAALAAREARCATLGQTLDETVDKWISDAVRGRDDWVLIGGPPCQAYSLVGRSRKANVDRGVFESDHRHVLYREYLRIIRKFRPAVFVMENVKGILSATLGGERIFDRIRKDLSMPEDGLQYEIRSFVRPEREGLAPGDFVIRAEHYGVPQARHRVILLGVRSDLACRLHEPLVAQAESATVRQVLEDLPPLRGGVSRGEDSHQAWLRALRATSGTLADWRELVRRDVLAAMRDAITDAEANDLEGGRFVPWAPAARAGSDLERWLRDPSLGGLPNHEARRHMVSDLQRYFFAACFARVVGGSPKLGDFPEALLPNHGNVGAEDVPFQDRFRVQLWSRPATTVVSHIAKDGHYFIHPDPSQARSLTARESARLQTFPDNYFFEGNRTQQYTQVGNAVPPFLARQLAGVVSGILRQQAARSEVRAA